MKKHYSNIHSQRIDKDRNIRTKTSFLERVSDINFLDVLKAIILLVVLVVSIMLQTTVFSTLRIFGAVPDLLLSFIIGVSIAEGAERGSIAALIGAYCLECLSGYGMTILPLLYVSVAVACGLFSKYSFRDSILTRIIFTSAACAFKELFTMLYAYQVPGAEYTFGYIFGKIMIPEFFATLIMSVFVQLFIWLILKPFGKKNNIAED